MYNILICDDEKDIVSALKIYLEAEGYTTFTACNGLEALDVLRREKVHLVVLGLNVGADDYVTKPFNPVELCARVRSQLRRYMLLGGGKTEEGSLTIGPIRLDEKAKEVTRDGEQIALTPTEYEILCFLMRHAGEVFPPKELYRRVWNGEPYGAENTVSVHIRHLREKLEINPAEPRFIKAVWGRGYKFEKPERSGT